MVYIAYVAQKQLSFAGAEDKRPLFPTDLLEIHQNGRRPETIVAVRQA